MAQSMVLVLPFSTANLQVRHLRISLPLVPSLLDGRKYHLPDTLPPPTGLELRSAFRPKFLDKSDKPQPLDKVT
jgi:hypothetical protein